MKQYFLVLIGIALNLTITNRACADEWRIFGTHGIVQLTPKGGKTSTLNNDKSLMMMVPNGSTLAVKGKGKVVVVSLKSRQAFEIGDNSSATVESDTIRAQTGSVNPKSGFAAPTGKEGKMGGIVMRGVGNQRSCLKAVSPVNTAILDLTPELRWDNHCSGLAGVSLTILSDERIVYSADVISGSTFRLPKNILKEGNRYLWMIDGGASFDMASGVFMLPGGTARAEALQRMQEARSATAPEDRIAYIIFLSDRGFLEMSKEESRRLRDTFPEAAGLTELP